MGEYNTCNPTRRGAAHLLVSAPGLGMRLLLCSVAMALCSTRHTYRVEALPTDFSVIKGNKGIAKLSAGKNLADAQRELHRNFRNPLMYANAWPVAQWDTEMRLSATANRVLTLLLQAASANAYVFISSKACEIAKNTARRAKFLLDNPRHGDVSGKYAVVFTFHLLAQLERYVTVNLKVMWRNCERRFTSLAEMREWRGDAWDFNDPNETGIIGLCEFEGCGGVGGYIEEEARQRRADRRGPGERRSGRRAPEEKAPPRRGLPEAVGERAPGRRRGAGGRV